MRRAPLAVTTLLVVLFARTSFASDDTEQPKEEQPRLPADRWAFRPSVMSGLGQWILFGGGNIAGQIKVGRFVAEYSHGQALDYDRLGGFAKSPAERRAGVSVFSPWTTGGGVGFEITPRLHVL